MRARTLILLGAWLVLAAWLAGCDNSPLPLGQDVATSTPFTGPPMRWISWSPQGDAIVYEQAGTLIVGRGADLKDARRITGRGTYRHPAWSPDGRFIVHDYAPDRFHQSNLWIRSADRSEEAGVPRRLTDTPSPDFMPVWSRDGRWIAFHSRRSPGNHVWLISAEGGTPRPFAEASADENSLDWSPHGARLAFVSSKDGSRDIWVGDADTDEVRKFAGTPATESFPRWRPDGKAIGYLSLARQGRNVWVREEGREPRQITHVGKVLMFGWLMGGDAVMFQTENGKVYAQLDQEGADPVYIRDAAALAVSPDGSRYVYVQPVETYFRYYADDVPPPFLR